jgi:hypothetical protein
MSSCSSSYFTTKKLKKKIKKNQNYDEQAHCLSLLPTQVSKLEKDDKCNLLSSFRMTKRTKSINYVKHDCSSSLLAPTLELQEERIVVLLVVVFSCLQPIAKQQQIVMFLVIIFSHLQPIAKRRRVVLVIVFPHYCDVCKKTTKK